MYMSNKRTRVDNFQLQPKKPVKISKKRALASAY